MRRALLRPTPGGPLRPGGASGEPVELLGVVLLEPRSDSTKWSPIATVDRTGTGTLVLQLRGSVYPMMALYTPNDPRCTANTRLLAERSAPCWCVIPLERSASRSRA